MKDKHKELLISIAVWTYIVLAIGWIVVLGILQ